MNPDSTGFHIPHASTCIPPEYLSDFYENVLTENLLRMTDRYTDELFDFGFGERIVFPVSRLLCDPERFRDDGREEMAKIGMGAVYLSGYDRKPLRRGLNPERREEILRAYYDPHHRLLEEKTKNALTRFGTCLIIDCHSFSPIPLPYEKDSLRPDICIGTDRIHTPCWLSTALKKSFRGAGLSVRLNRPFSGTIVPMKYDRTEPHVFSVMVEVNRRLYLAEDGKKSQGFSEIFHLLRRVIVSEIIRRNP